MGVRNNIDIFLKYCIFYEKKTNSRSENENNQFTSSVIGS